MSKTTLSDGAYRFANNLQSLKRPRLTTLIYHQVLPEADPLRPWEMDKNRFRQHLDWICGIYNVLPLREAVERLHANSLAPGSLCITFDDGYLNNATVALEILREFHFTATFFCTSAFLDGELMWNDKVIESIRDWPRETVSIDRLGINELPCGSNEEKVKAITETLDKLKYIKFEERLDIADGLIQELPNTPAPQMMTTHKIKLLHQAGMEIGGHTHTHPILTRLAANKAEQQICQNKEILEGIICERLKSFAYPNGKPGQDYTSEHIGMVQKAGYNIATTTATGGATSKTDRLQIPRATPWDRSRNKFLARMLMNSNKKPHCY